MTYVDASAILRVLFDEPGPAVPLGAEGPVVSSVIVEVETCRALDRARLIGELDDLEVATKRRELTEIIARMDLVRVDRAVIDRAKLPFGVNLRTLDAIHVATAELVGTEAGIEIEFWTYDDRQRVAALARGLTVRGG